MNFDDAILAHSEWKRKLKQYLSNPDHSLQAADVEKDDQCKVGEWLFTGGGHKYSCLEEFKTLVAAHAAFHRAAADLVRAADRGEIVSVEDVIGLGTEFSKATSKVVSALVEMKAKM
jgi:hypothetical protein